MISDVLSDAVAALDHYLHPDFDAYYPDKKEILRVRNSMDRLRVKLDGQLAVALAAPRKRRADSVRFDPYYKVQTWNETDLCWRDIQKQFSTAEAAKAAFPYGVRCRIMTVDEKGRRPL
jgi:hypothetical protein